MEIIHDLLIKCNLGEGEIRSQAVQTLLEMREENKNSFLQMISVFLKNNDHSSNSLDALALILAYQSISFPIDLSEFDDDLLNELLNISSSFFSSDDSSLQLSAATLFSRIMINDQISEDKLETNEFLLNLFSHPSSPLIIHPLSIIISDFCCYCQPFIDSNFILSILESLTLFFQIESSEIDCYCLNIISTLIPLMGEVMTTEIEKLFPLLLQFCQNPTTATKSFDCLTLITEHFYPLLEIFLPILTSSDFLDLISLSENLDENEDIINSYLSFWKSISQIEDKLESDNHNMNIIQNTIFQLISIILKIISLSKSEIFDSDSSDPTIQANQVLNLILSSHIDESRSILETFITDFETSEIFGEREAVLSSIFFLIHYLDDEDISEEDTCEYFRLIQNGLEDEVPRVRQTAVFCGEAFCEKYQTSNDQSIEIIQNIILKIAEDEFVAKDAAHVLGNLFTITNFPYFEDSMNVLLELASNSDFNQAKSAFESLSQFIIFSDSENREKLLDSLLQILEDFSSINEFHLHELIDLLTELIYKLKNQIDNKFDVIWDLLSEGVGKFTSLFIIPISEISFSCPEKFSPFLHDTLSLIHDVLNTEDFQQACASLKILLEYKDLADFIPLIMEISETLIKLLINKEISAPNKRIVVEVFDKINQEIPSIFESVFDTVFPLIADLAFELDDWEDFDSNSAFLRFFKRILTNEEIEQEVLLSACESIFHIMSLVIKCPKMDIYHLDSVIDALYLISKIFPDLLNQFYQQNLSLEILLNYSLSIKEIDLVKIGYITHILNLEIENLEIEN